MIETLTPQQESLFPVYRDKWLKIGLSTERIGSIDRLRPAIDDFYTLLGREKPAAIVSMPGPIHAWLAVCFLSQVGSQVGSQVMSQVESQVELVVWPYFSGNLWASWFAYYDYLHEALGLPLVNGYFVLRRCAMECSLVYPLDEACVVCGRPEILRMVNGQLHRDGGPAWSYSDGTKGWSLNGVQVPQWLAETPARDWDIREKWQDKELQNAEVRREFCRKVGIDMLVQRLGAKQIDKRGDYELLDLQVRDGEVWRYLRMKNPSVPGVWHVEGIPREVETVEAALRWREPPELQKIVRSENGQDYWQQGDVYIWPQSAKVLKPMPAIMT